MNQHNEPHITFDDRPEREDIIERDEIVGMVIDLETMSPENFFSTYFFIE
jgi:hypothetical protein